MFCTRSELRYFFRNSKGTRYFLSSLYITFLLPLIYSFPVCANLNECDSTYFYTRPITNRQHDEERKISSFCSSLLNSVARSRSPDVGSMRYGRSCLFRVTRLNHTAELYAPGTRVTPRNQIDSPYKLQVYVCMCARSHRIFVKQSCHHVTPRKLWRRTYVLINLIQILRHNQSIFRSSLYFLYE